MRFRGLFGATLPRSAVDPAQLFLVDARRGIRPLGLDSEALVPPHMGLIEFRGPAVVNDVQLLGGGYFPLAGHQMTILPGGAKASDAPRVAPKVEAGPGLPGAVDMPSSLGKALGRLDSSLLTSAHPAGLVGRVAIFGGRLTAGHPSNQQWTVDNPIKGGKSSAGNFAHELWLEIEASTHTVSFQMTRWNGDQETLFTVRPLADQDLDVIVSNVCGVLPSTCMEDYGRSDMDFRALYQLLAPEERKGWRAAAAIKGFEGLPVPTRTEKALDHKPCYFALFDDPR